MVDCSHVFRDSNKCVKCGTGVARLLLNERAEWALVTRQLRADLARVTEERDTAIRGNEALQRSLQRELDAARAETERLREELELMRKQYAEKHQAWVQRGDELERYTNCWHCGDALLEEDPYHCETCPAWDCCDEGACDAPGCIERTSDPEPTT
jgi:hypothetical protein